MKQLAQVIMLPTKDIMAPLAIFSNRLYLNGAINFANVHSKPQHLYITSNEEIREGDWFIDIIDNHVQQLTFIPKSDIGAGSTRFKIIATTDKSLKIPDGKPYMSQDLMKIWVHPTKSLPTFKQSFIKEYCAKGGIDKVLVEYQERQQFESADDYNYNTGIELKINPDNTINIFPIKDNWSREEVEKLFKKYKKDSFKGLMYNYQFKQDDWIKENL